MAQIDITKERSGTFGDALAGAEPGDEIVYHVGDRIGGAHRREAFAAGSAELCILYQRRLEGGMFAYIACKPKGKK
jgi:hypothetical protein